MRAILSVLVLLAASAMAKPLEIYFIDTEGGKSTLIVSPSGQSLLIDTGYAGFSGRDSDRILTAAKLAHVKKIDYVLITHHHGDHEGGVANLLQRFQVGTFLLPGPTAETAGAQLKGYQSFEAAVEKQHRELMKPGDKIGIKGLDITVVEVGGKHIERGGARNPYCDVPAPKEDIPENARSAGIVLEFGKFRYADFGDLTADKEEALLCPENRVGKVDVYQTAHHGAESARAIYGLEPRVAVMNNGARKGGPPSGWKLVKGSPGLEDLWQLHFSVEGGKGANSPDSLIANVDEACEGKYLKLTAESTGAFTMFNSRNKFSKSYPAK